jgi:hypothetical protein
VDDSSWDYRGVDNWRTSVYEESFLLVTKNGGIQEKVVRVHEEATYFKIIIFSSLVVIEVDYDQKSGR